MAEGRLIVSNTTPIINLAEIGRLDVLDGLFGKVVVPPAVVDELIARSLLRRVCLRRMTCQMSRRSPFPLFAPADPYRLPVSTACQTGWLPLASGNGRRQTAIAEGSGFRGA